MDLDELKELSFDELEKLLTHKFKALHLTNIMEHEIRSSGISQYELQSTRDQILDDILLIQHLLKRPDHDTDADQYTDSTY